MNMLHAVCSKTYHNILYDTHKSTEWWIDNIYTYKLKLKKSNARYDISFTLAVSRTIYDYFVSLNQQHQKTRQINFQFKEDDSNSKMKQWVAVLLGPPLWRSVKEWVLIYPVGSGGPWSRPTVKKTISYWLGSSLLFISSTRLLPVHCGGRGFGRERDLFY